MRKAKVKFKLVLEFNTEVEQYEEDFSLEKEIELRKEYLETQREDLYWALQNSDLISVEILKIKEFKDKFVPDYNI